MNFLLKLLMTIGVIGILIYSTNQFNKQEPDKAINNAIDEIIQLITPIEIDETEEATNAEIVPEPEGTKQPVKQEEPVQQAAPVETEIKDTVQIQEQEVEAPEPVIPVQEETVKEDIAFDNVKAIDRAKNLTSGYCSADLWGKWEDRDRKGNEGGVGMATRSMTVEWADDNYVETIDTLFINTFISPELDGDIEQSTHTAWHECAHANSYIIPVDQQEAILKEIQQQFGDCGKHSSNECLADAMAHIKLGAEDIGYYQQVFNEQELDLAERIWSMTPEAQPVSVYNVDAYNRF